MKLKAFRAVLGLTLLLLAATASTPALAWHQGGHARFGVFIGAPGYWNSPYYYPPYYSPYYPPYAYAPVVVAPPAPLVYIEQGAAPAPAQTMPPAQAAAPSNWWYYCADAKGYYPYVKECPSAWQPVAPQPQTK